MKSKRTIAFIAGFVALAIATCIFFHLHTKRPEQPTIEKFSLSSEFIGNNEFREITASELSELIAQKKSFIVVPRMIYCPSGMPMATNAETIAAKDNIVILSLLQTEFKESELSNTIKYLPSAAIYKNGELIDWLDAESDADNEYYENPEGFERWLSSYIEL